MPLHIVLAAFFPSLNDDVNKSRNGIENRLQRLRGFPIEAEDANIQNRPQQAASTIQQLVTPHTPARVRKKGRVSERNLNRFPETADIAIRHCTAERPGSQDARHNRSYGRRAHGRQSCRQYGSIWPIRDNVFVHQLAEIGGLVIVV